MVVKRSELMKCPIDDTELVMTERQSVEIDYCPKCRGVWLDRGELDKIIERAETEVPRQAPSALQPEYEQPYRNEGKHGGGHGNEYGYGKKKRRESWLGELFD